MIQNLFARCLSSAAAHHTTLAAARACRSPRLLAALLLLSPLPALAQTSPVGLWACQMAYTEFNEQGRTGGFIREYFMAVEANGTFRAEGQFAHGGTGVSPFAVQGDWRVGPTGLFEAAGPEQSPMAAWAPIVFVVTGQISSDGTRMNVTEELPDPTSRYIMQRTINICERRE